MKSGATLWRHLLKRWQHLLCTVPEGTVISPVLEKWGLGELYPKVEKNSNYDYFELSIFLIQMKSKITNYSIRTKTNIVIT